MGNMVRRVREGHSERDIEMGWAKQKNGEGHYAGREVKAWKRDLAQ